MTTCVLAATRHLLTAALRTACNERVCFQVERDAVHAQCEHRWPMSSISTDYLLQYTPHTRLYPKMRVPALECGLYVHVKSARKPPCRPRGGQAGARKDVDQLWRGIFWVYKFIESNVQYFADFAEVYRAFFPSCANLISRRSQSITTTPPITFE